MAVDPSHSSAKGAFRNNFRRGVVIQSPSVNMQPPALGSDATFLKKVFCYHQWERALSVCAQRQNIIEQHIAGKRSATPSDVATVVTALRFAECCAHGEAAQNIADIHRCVATRTGSSRFYSVGAAAEPGKSRVSTLLCPAILLELTSSLVVVCPLASAASASDILSLIGVFGMSRTISPKRTRVESVSLDRQPQWCFMDRNIPARFTLSAHVLSASEVDSRRSVHVDLGLSPCLLDLSQGKCSLFHAGWLLGHLVADRAQSQYTLEVPPSVRLVFCRRHHEQCVLL